MQDYRQFSRQLIVDLLTQSPAYRDYVIDTFLFPSVDIDVRKIIDTNRACNHKINAIKEVRAFAKGKLQEFIDAYPAICTEKYFYTIGEPTTIGLADAKSIVELYY